MKWGVQVAGKQLVTIVLELPPNGLHEQNVCIYAVSLCVAASM